MFAYLFTERVVCLNKTELLAFQKKKTELLLYCWITAGADGSYAASQPLFTLFAVLVLEAAAGVV